ncbi:MAG: hypothetical protein AAB537_02340, partial [Patescibacteria group bacterium]
TAEWENFFRFTLPRKAGWAPTRIKIFPFRLRYPLRRGLRFKISFQRGEASSGDLEASPPSFRQYKKTAGRNQPLH